MPMRPLLFWVAGVTLLTACGESATPTSNPNAPVDSDEPPVSVILVIGDGMGPQQMGLLFDWAAAAEEEPTALEQLMNSGTVGMLRTASIESPSTDSAAAATAFASGVAVKNNVIALTAAGQEVRTVMDDAIAAGRRTGIVTTTRITHATPACFIAHIDDRDKEDEIALQIVDSEIDLIMGGGAQYFLSERQNLQERIRERGWRLVESLEDCGKIQDDDRVLGLFASSHLPYVLDRDEPDEETSPTLAELTEIALDFIGPSRTGFFLLVEGGRIDHAGHANDVAGILGEMREFDDALAVTLEYQRKNPRTLVLVTADHETGGLCVTYGPTEVIMAQDLIAMTQAKSSVEVGIEKNTMRLGPAEAEPLGVGRGIFYSPTYYASSYTGLKESAKYKVSFGTGNHSTTPVAILARGPQEELFGGLHRSTWIGQQLRGWMALEARVPATKR